MPRPDYIPRPDADCRAWAINLSRKLDADPERFGLSAAEAAALRALAEVFSAALDAALQPMTRTPPVIRGKESARRAWTRAVRPVARRVKSWPGVTEKDLIDLGLTIDGRRPKPTGPPASGPVLTVRPERGCRLRLSILPATGSGTRQKPRGALAAGIWVRVDDPAAPDAAPPPACTEEDGFRFTALATASTHVLQLAPRADGRHAWVIARWFDTRGRQSPPGPAARATVVG